MRKEQQQDDGWVPVSVADEGRLEEANCGTGGENWREEEETRWATTAGNLGKSRAAGNLRKAPEETTGGGKRKKQDGRIGDGSRQQATPARAVGFRRRRTEDRRRPRSELGFRGAARCV
ncbi:hypothetical protein ACLOJK_028178 [Asimina triloba]